MAIATLDAILTKARKLTGTGTSLQLTDSQIIDYVNSFYLYDFPAQYRALKLKDRYTFNTVRGIDIYPFDSDHYTTVEMPCYCMKRIIQLFQQPWGNSGFWGSSSNWQFQQNLTQGDGTAGQYTGTLTNHPIIRSVNNNPMVQTALNPTYTPPVSYLRSPSLPAFTNQGVPGRVQNILITANTALGVTQNVTDNGAGILIGDVDSTATNTINYETGAIQITFASIVPSGENIVVQYSPTMPMSIPLSILFFQNQFTLRPIPDKGYTIELIAYRLPSQALLGTDNPDAPILTGRPEYQDWWECLAYGAAKKIYEDRVDPDGVALMANGLAERYNIAEVRTYAQLGKQRIGTIYADQLNNYAYGAYGSGSGNS